MQRENLQPLIDAFYQLCEESGNTVEVETIRNNALQKLASGESKTLINSSIGGKSFNYNLSMSAEKLFQVTSAAIRRYNIGNLTMTRPDFSFN